MALLCVKMNTETSGNFFQAFFSQLLKLRSNCEDLSSIWSFIRSSNICFIYLHSFIHPSRVYYELTIWPAPSWLDSSVGRALHRHRRGHGFESRSSLNFFQAFFSQLLKLCSNCEYLSFIWSLHTVNSLLWRTPSTRDFALVSLMARVRNSRNLFQSNVCNLFLPGI